MWVLDLGLSRYLTLITVLPTVVLAPLIACVGKNVVFSPIFVTYLMVLFANTIRYFVLSFNTDYFVERYHLDSLTLEEFTAGAEIYMVGIVALAIGYLGALVSGPSAKKKSYSNSPVRRNPLSELTVSATRVRRIDLVAFTLVTCIFLGILIPYLLQTGFIEDFSNKRVIVDEDGTTYRFGASRFCIAIFTIFFQLVLVYSRIATYRKALLVSLVSLIAIAFLGVTLSKRSLLLASLLPVILLYLRQINFRSNLKIATTCALTICVVGDRYDRKKRW